MKRLSPTKKSVLCLILVLVSVGYFYKEEQGNFHEITPGEAYRSGQLDRDELEYYIGKFGIRSILNLRGSNPGEAWYREELAVSEEMKVQHYDIALSATSEPTKEDVERMLEIFAVAPRPLLIHCQAGADRSGLAAAMWKTAVDGRPKSEARKELSLLYGHMPVGKTVVLDRFFDSWDPPGTTGGLNKRSTVHPAGRTGEGP